VFDLVYVIPSGSQGIQKGKQKKGAKEKFRNPFIIKRKPQKSLSFSELFTSNEVHLVANLLYMSLIIFEDYPKSLAIKMLPFVLPNFQGCYQIENFFIQHVLLTQN
jgi:hypothetical protein